MKNKLKISLLFVMGAFAYAVIPNFASAAQSPAGSNVRIDGDIYYITSDGQKRLYGSEAIYLSYGFNSLTDLTPGSVEDAALKLGNPMPPRDGKVICSNSNYDLGTCYLITDFKKAAFPSEEVMNSQGFSLSGHLVGDVSLIPSTTPIIAGEPHRYGTLINKAGTIYFVGKNGLLGFPSFETLKSWGYTFSDVVPAGEGDDSLIMKITVENRFAGEFRPFEPIIPEQLVLDESEKFIVPFSGKTLPITEGWLYSSDERSIHGYVNHGGIDFAGLRGVPIYAAASGYAVSSTHLVPLAKTYQDKTPLGFGLGEFVQIWHPDQGVYTSYSHLQRVEDEIPYFEPECDDTGYCDPSVIYNDTAYITKKGTYVEQGDLIGWMGDSGLVLGSPEQPRVERDHKDQPSWDEVHLHFEMYTRDTVNFYKAKRYDPFNIYGRANQYTESSYANPGSLWRLNSNNIPVLAE